MKHLCICTNRNLNQTKKTMANPHILTKMFAKRSFIVNSSNRISSYNFRFFSEDTPYIPLNLLALEEHCQPINFMQMYGWSFSKYYLTMLRDTFTYGTDTITRHKTQSNNYYGLGGGQFYEMFDRTSAEANPILMVVIPHHIYHDVKGTTNPFQRVLNEHKHSIEVFFHNNIGHVNQSLWKYIRKCYIETLELEGLRFSFKDPDRIWDLTSVTYQKPTFSSMKELKEYKEDINNALTLETRQ